MIVRVYHAQCSDVKFSVLNPASIMAYFAHYLRFTLNGAHLFIGYLMHGVELILESCNDLCLGDPQLDKTWSSSKERLSLSRPIRK